MEADYVQRLRMIFAKDGAARYISHLDLARALERALNRAKIPMAYTHGFNRRPRMQMASALPLGYTSSYELSDILLTKTVEPEQARQQLMATMAPGLDVTEMREVELALPSLQASTAASTYTAVPLDPIEATPLGDKVAKLLATETWPRQRRRKGKVREYDLRPLILDLRLQHEPDSPPTLHMHLSLQPGLTGRPDEVLQVLDLDPLDCHVHRTRIILQDEL